MICYALRNGTEISYGLENVTGVFGPIREAEDMDSKQRIGSSGVCRS